MSNTPLTDAELERMARGGCPGVVCADFARALESTTVSWKLSRLIQTVALLVVAIAVVFAVRSCDPAPSTPVIGQTILGKVGDDTCRPITGQNLSCNAPEVTNGEDFPRVAQLAEADCLNQFCAGSNPATRTNLGKRGDDTMQSKSSLSHLIPTTMVALLGLTTGLNQALNVSETSRGGLFVSGGLESRQAGFCRHSPNDGRYMELGSRVRVRPAHEFTDRKPCNAARGFMPRMLITVPVNDFAGHGLSSPGNQRSCCGLQFNFVNGDSVPNARDANSGIRVGTAQCLRLDLACGKPTAGRAFYRPPSQSPLRTAHEFTFSNQRTYPRAIHTVVDGPAMGLAGPFFHGQRTIIPVNNLCYLSGFTTEQWLAVSLI